MLKAESILLLEDIEAAIKATDRETLYRSFDSCRRIGHEWLALEANPVSRRVALYCWKCLRVRFCENAEGWPVLPSA
jgi:hypothetical protein